MSGSPPEDDAQAPAAGLRSGWTTGACATAATQAACWLLLGDQRPASVTITLPRGQTPSFEIVAYDHGVDQDGTPWAQASVIKDAGDDPDVTHGATITATVRPAAADQGITFHAGIGVGTVTKPGLPIPPGEPAINPVPRQLMRAEIVALCLQFQRPADIAVTISVPNGEKLAQATWNPRLGILGGLSILGTTGVVIPYSCSAWIHSIQRGIDVARATSVDHVVGCVGNTSEKAACALLGLSPEAVIDMGDFVGGMLKYLRRHPVPQVTIAGGFAKIAKLAAGAMDLHSKRSQVDFAWLAACAQRLGASPALVDQIAHANTALAALTAARAAELPLAPAIALRAAQVARGVLDGAPIVLHVLAFDRQGQTVGDSRAALSLPSLPDPSP